MSRINTDADTGSDRDADRPDRFTAVDDLLLSLPEPQPAPDRFAARHAALVQELDRHGQGSVPVRGRLVTGRPPVFALRRLLRTRRRIALAGAAVGLLAVALALEQTAGGPRNTPDPAPTRLDTILADSWTATYTGLTGPAATAAQAACVSWFNEHPDSFPQTIYYHYDHISDSTIAMGVQQGQVTVIMLRAGFDLLTCLEVPAADGSGALVAYPLFGLGPGYSNAGVVEPANFTPTGSLLPLNGDWGPRTLGPANDSTAIDYYVGLAAADVAMVTVEIVDPATGATQDVSEKINAGTFFFWWPAKEGRWAKATAYAADGKVLGTDVPTSIPSPYTSVTPSK